MSIIKISTEGHKNSFSNKNNIDIYNDNIIKYFDNLEKEANKQQHKIVYDANNDDYVYQANDIFGKMFMELYPTIWETEF